MKQTLVIGSTVVDVLLNLPALPGRGEDINITSSEYRLGGCAYTVFKTLKLFKSRALLCSPVGSGIYGKMVREQLEKESIFPFVNLEEENGCCYCLIEADGERSFLSSHGAEYCFSRSWMNDLDYAAFDSVYISGIDVEDASGEEIVEFVYEHPELELYFSPGPRVTQIEKKRMERLLCRRDNKGRGPLIHLNEREALAFSGKSGIEAAAEFLADKTGNAALITLGEKGCYCLSNKNADGRYIPGFPARVVDTVGAGDTHCGAFIACRKEGMTLEEACLKANRVGAAAVGIRGAALDALPAFN